MSSTNRGYDRHKSDYYVTPKDEIRKFIKYSKEYIWYLQNYDILDPYAGGDKNNPMSYPEVLKENSMKNIDTIDLREDSKAEIKTNFLEFNSSKKYDIIISNPPFNLALEFIEKGLSLLKEDGYLIFLLRLNFFGSKIRNEFLLKHIPEYVFIHSKRMSFTPNGKKDSIEYAHFVFRKNANYEYTKTILLPYD
jgi:hypothetical protein